MKALIIMSYLFHNLCAYIMHLNIVTINRVGHKEPAHQTSKPKSVSTCFDRRHNNKWQNEANFRQSEESRRIAVCVNVFSSSLNKQNMKVQPFDSYKYCKICLGYAFSLLHDVTSPVNDMNTGSERDG